MTARMLHCNQASSDKFSLQCNLPVKYIVGTLLPAEVDHERGNALQLNVTFRVCNGGAVANGGVTRDQVTRDRPGDRPINGENAIWGQVP